MASAAASEQAAVRYLAYGRTVTTVLQLPELATAPASVDRGWIVTLDDTFRYPHDLRWRVLLREPNAEPHAISAHDGAGGCFIRFGPFTDAHASPDRIRLVPRGYVTRATLRHILLDQVLPLSLAASGEIVLHAAAVSCEDHTIVVCGPAGVGKSTLAAALCRLGHSVLADDGVLVRQIQGVTATGSYADLRLWPASAAALGFSDVVPVGAGSSKVRVRHVAPSSTTSRPIDRVYVLARGAELQFERLEGQRALTALVANAFRSDLGDARALEHQLAALQQLAGSSAVWRLTLPDDLSRILDAAHALSDHACTPSRW